VRVSLAGGVVTLLVALASCGGPSAKTASSPSGDGASPASTLAKPATPAPPERYEPGITPADVVAPFVRPERSSRLTMSLPKGKARERWTFPLDPKLDPAFIVTTGTRIVVQGRPKGPASKRQSPFVIVDTEGRRVGDDAFPGELVRLEPASGKLYGIGGTELPGAWLLADASFTNDKLGPEDPRTVQGALAVHAAAHDGAHVFLQASGVEVDVGGRQRTVVEPPVQPLDCAIDDEGNLHLVVRQAGDLALWTTPLSGGSFGRIRLGPLRRDRADVPPILGKTVRVVLLDDRMIAVGRDGKTLWERKGALTGGATISEDDRLLVASDAKLLAIDPSGRAIELASVPKEVFLTPPIITGGGLVLVASGVSLHAWAFE
jgi:hypothetical protein